MTKTVIRKLKVFNSYDPATIIFNIKTLIPSAYVKLDEEGNHYGEIEKLAPNNFADKEPVFNSEGYDKTAEYYICKMFDGQENFKQTDYIAVLAPIKEKGSKLKDCDRGYER